jgi:hypothetical protein
MCSTRDYSTPTCLTEGWMQDDLNMAVPPSETEVHSAAATVFALWRSMLIKKQQLLDATLTAVGLGSEFSSSFKQYSVSISLAELPNARRNRCI